MSLQKTFLRYISSYLIIFVHIFYPKSPRSVFQKNPQKSSSTTGAFGCHLGPVGQKKIHGEIRHSAPRLRTANPSQEKELSQRRRPQRSNLQGLQQCRFFEFFRKTPPKIINTTIHENFLKNMNVL